MPSTLKILVVGPKGSGKSTISNFLAELSEGLGSPGESNSNYKPTLGVRILECEKELDRGRVTVELWDCSGDQLYEPCWPALMKDAQGVVLVYDPDKPTDDQEIGLWCEWFVQNPGLDAKQCLGYGHHGTKRGAQSSGGRLPGNIHTINSNHESPGIIRTGFMEYLGRLNDFLNSKQGYRK